MALQRIDIPDSIRQVPLSSSAERLIDEANDRIEAFMLSDQVVRENFVTCDFWLVDQTLEWIGQNHLLAGNRFCELGSGFGVVAMLAAIRGLESVGIEIDSVLAAQSGDLAEDLEIDAQFFRGSFIPREVAGVLEASADIEHIFTNDHDVYEDIGLGMDDFDLLFAFPWPGEQSFFEAMFEQCAADGALLLTYRGRDGTHLLRKA
jgi:hypothetical protein